MNLRKTPILVAFILIAFLICSCGENEMNQSVGIEDENEMHELIMPYLFLNGQQYELRLSKAEAFKKGISKDQYEEAYFDIQQLNAYIQDHITDPNYNFVLNDPQQKKRYCQFVV